MADKVAEREAESFGELVERYLREHAVKKRSAREDERIARRELLPALGRHRAKASARRQVRDVVRGSEARGAGVMANRTLALVRKIFNFAVAEEIVAANPCAGIARPTAEQQRDRVLSADEIRAIWSACDHEPAWVAAAIWLYLLTAQRKDEILAMRWDEVDFGSGWWTIPAERAKNGLAHRVWLSSPAQRILKELRLRAGGSAFVFPSPRGDQPVATLQKPLDRIRKSTGVEFRIHDLRRTAASHMTGAGSRV